ncbi:hypothetical protein [Pseudomonas saxonica]|uniref:Uncharacterized protein n=1 Tax=Pseudomonas saxonica TaxID=2600598 RepID=A0A5C5PYV4_9PSED|nr:hypothetical protein [Pseudomonas saxonica]TWR95480.1 hypothetical protein FJD37_09820 [Pseudomonas saxonica]
MKVFQKVFQQKNKPDINVINQLFINPVQITPAHQFVFPGRPRKAVKPREIEALRLFSCPRFITYSQGTQGLVGHL